MKKTRYAVLLVAVLALVPSVSSAVEVEGCDRVATWDGQLAAIHGVLGGLGVEGLSAAWTGLDIESATGPMSGDGVPDWYQAGLLAATLCSAEKDAGYVLTQFNGNVAVFNGLMTQLGDALAAVPDPAADMGTVGAALGAWATALPDDGSLGPEVTALRDGALQLAAELQGAGTELEGFVTEFGDAVSTLLPMFAEGFAALAGMSSEGNATMMGLFDDLAGDVPGQATLLVTAAQGIAFVVTNAAALDGSPYEMDAQLKLDAMALAEDLAGASLDGSGGLALLFASVDPAPVFVIYDLAGSKLADEEFSAFGDYDGDGLTNGAVYAAMAGAGLDMEDTASRDAWVAAASGSAGDFWPGNPGLPVASTAGLVLLAVALGGAAATRKK